MHTQPDPPAARRGWLSRIRAIADLYTYPLRLSHYVALVNPLWTTHQLQARVVGVWDETRNARTLTLKPGLNWRGHRAGQHVRVGVPVDGRQYTRTYTISSPPERRDGRFTITVKAIDDGRISQHLVRQIKVGDYLPVGLPQGSFHLPDAQPVRPLFITAGSGVTPAASMIRSLVAQERLPDTVHVHYAPHAHDFIFGPELSALAQEQARYQLHSVYTADLGDRQSSREHFSPEQLEELCPDWRERDVYACGPPGLLAALEQHFAACGRSAHLHIERFRADFAGVPRDAQGGEVSFTLSGVRTTAAANQPLLRVAEDAGLNPQHGCRMGICHSCTTVLVSGAVRDLRDGQLHNEAGSRIQTCVCAAAGDCTLEL